MRIKTDHPLSVRELCRVLHLPPPTEEQSFSGITTDSRLVEPGDLFIPLQGEHDNGHRYLHEAQARGAAMILSENGDEGCLHVGSTRKALIALGKGRLSEIAPTVIGITGSVGKTGAKDAIAAVLATHYRVHRTAKNENNDLGLAYTLLALPRDCQMLVLELGSNHPGEIAALSEVAPPDMAVITAVGAAHIGAFGSREAILREKAAILSRPHTKHLLLNGDDPLLRKMEVGIPTCFIGTEAGCDLRAEKVFTSRFGTTYTLTTEKAQHRVFLRGTGRPRIYSSLFALGVANILSLPFPSSAEALFRMTYAESRQSIEAVGGVLLIDDSYNASPEAVAEALSLLSSVASGRERYAVLGDMLELGEMAEDLHREAGQLAAQKADHLYAFGIYAHAYARGALEGGMSREQIHTFEDAEKAAHSLTAHLSDGAVVLVKASHTMHGSLIVTAIKRRGA